MPFIELNGCSCYYEHRPGGPRGTVVFLNGIMSPLESWDAQLPLLEQLGYGALRWEYRSQWRSARSSGGFSFADLAADLAALLDALELDRVHLCGTSYGGFIGMQFAADYPQRSASLLALTTAARFLPISEAVVQRWRQLATEGDAMRLFQGMSPDLFSPRQLAQGQEAIAARATGMATATADLPEFLPGQVDLYDANLPELRGEGMLPRLARIGCPTTVVAGEHDRIYPPACSAEISAHIEGAEYLIAAEAGHALVFEQPRTVNLLLAGHLAAAEAPPD